VFGTQAKMPKIQLLILYEIIVEKSRKLQIKKKSTTLNEYLLKNKTSTARNITPLLHDAYKHVF
jgi:hypothetical protein